jgi:hypothetical protein
VTVITMFAVAKKLVRNTLTALPMLVLAGCGQSNSQIRGDAPGLIAMAAPATDSSYRGDLTPFRPGARFGEDVLSNPAERFAVVERLRTEIAHKTRQMPDSRWYTEVRPLLRRQLEQAGLSRGDVTFLLWEVDQARPASVD